MTSLIQLPFVSTDNHTATPQIVRQGSQAQPIRVLHVVGRMDRAGIETWLMHVLRHVDRSRFQLDFLVHGNTPGHYDAEIRSLGSELLHAPPLRELWRYQREIKKVLRNAPPYDIVHSHLDLFSGYPLKCATQAGVPVRIAHSHSDARQRLSHLRWSRRLFANRGQSLTVRYATHSLAASAIAGESLFGKRNVNPRWKVLPCGIDMTPFSQEHDRKDVRLEFDISENAVVVGHVGRFGPEKNHKLIVDIAEALSKRSPHLHLVLVGDGPLRSTIEANINERGLRNRVTLTGVRADVPRLFTSLFDLFLFPSLSEGLGLVAIEALAAGCPIVISDVVPPEVDVVPSLVTRMPLSAPAEQWADAVLRAASTSPSHEEKAAAFEAVSKSPYNISKCIQDLTRLYTCEISNLRAA